MCAGGALRAGAAGVARGAPRRASTRRQEDDDREFEQQKAMLDDMEALVSQIERARQREPGNGSTQAEPQGDGGRQSSSGLASTAASSSAWRLPQGNPEVSPARAAANEPSGQQPRRTVRHARAADGQSRSSSARVLNLADVRGDPGSLLDAPHRMPSAAERSSEEDDDAPTLL